MTLWLFIVALVLAACVAVLFRVPSLTLRQLRALELVAFGSVAAYLAISTYVQLDHSLLAADHAAALSTWNISLLRFVLLMGAYGTLVPNSIRRAAPIVAAMATVPLLVLLALSTSNPGHSAQIRAATSAPRVLDSLLLVAAGAGLAYMASHVMDRYFETAYKARIDRMYSLVERIGVGGMGEVWLAKHNMLARPAAVKLIRSSMLDEGDDKANLVLRRFELEAKSTASLRSPHTIEVYDFGVTDEGTFYYAMEHLDGIDLETLVERHGPVPARRVIYLLRQACESLAEAHRQRLTHRDIKPANIYAARLGVAHDFVKVLDFGIVKADQHEGGSTQLTLENATSGTPAYMAPEMAVDQKSVDGRADIYALGCVAYFLLAGVPVFDGDTPISVIVQHVNTVPRPPSERTEIELSADLEAVIMKCLAKAPSDRFQTAEALAEALCGCTDARGWTARDAHDWWQLHLPAEAA